MSAPLNNLRVVRKCIVVPAVGKRLCFAIDLDKPSASHRTWRIGQVGPAILVEKKVPDTNASSPVAKHVGEGAGPSAPVASIREIVMAWPLF